METIDNKKLLMLFEESDFTYTGLADDIGISRNTVHNIMFGHTSPSHYATAGLAEALDLSTEEIIEVFFPNINIEDSTDDVP